MTTVDSADVLISKDALSLILGDNVFIEVLPVLNLMRACKEPHHNLVVVKLSDKLSARQEDRLSSI